jgi:pimeloyl-ACP methyl ester carboxylesterase
MVPSRPRGAIAPSSPDGGAQTVPDPSRAPSPPREVGRSRPGFARTAIGWVAALAALALQACADAPFSPGREVASPATSRPAATSADAPPGAREAVSPLAERFVQADGVSLRYAERGAGGPPVVLLHGDGSMIEDFAASGLMERLAAGHRVVAFDRPGYGRSERPRDRAWTPEAQAALLADAFVRLGIDRPIVVGHSWGTLVALAMALDRPQAVRGLVLVSGYYYPVPRPAAALAALPAVPVLGDALRYTVAPVLGALLTPGLIAASFDPAPVPPRFAAGFPVGMTLRPEHIRASAEDSGLLTPSAAAFERRYGELRLPLAIVAGAEDRIVDPGLHSARLHREVPGSGLRLVPGQGHMVHHGAAGVVTAAVEAVAEISR